MQYDPNLDLTNPNDLKVSRTSDVQLKQPMAQYSHRSAQYRYCLLYTSRCV